ncbi:MAG: DUF4974 domain-containing protein [Prevotella sp.]|nr:DUF4974 domain-containing protein [Prevotella sp.]
MESNDKLEQLLRQMYAEESLHEEKDIDTSSIIDEEWAKFEAKHFGNATSTSTDGSADSMAAARSASPLCSAKKSSLYTLNSKLLKIAAMFIGVLMLSGIAYAAFHYFSGDPQPSANISQPSSLSPQPSTLNPQPSTLNPQPSTPIVFEDAELATILQEVATFYKCETVYKNEKVKHVRLYFTWDKTKSIDEIVETFNKFERFHITRENQKLIVE